MIAEYYIAIGLGLFIVLHLLTGIHAWRQAALRALGKISYRILFSFGVLYSIWMISQGFASRPFAVWWQVPDWASYAPLIVTPLGIFLLTSHFMPHDKDSFTRQPLGWAILFWALSHLIANGEGGTTILFGGFALYGALAIYLRERKSSLGDATASHGNAHNTRLIPFTRRPADMTGKKLAFLVGVTVVVVGVLIYCHDVYTGLSALPMLYN